MACSSQRWVEQKTSCLRGSEVVRYKNMEGKDGLEYAISVIAVNRQFPYKMYNRGEGITSPFFIWRKYMADIRDKYKNLKGKYREAVAEIERLNAEIADLKAKPAPVQTPAPSPVKKVAKKKVAKKVAARRATA